MNDNDELNDGAVLSAVRDSISGWPMPTPPRLEAITARGRARRRPPVLHQHSRSRAPSR
jgi:hypothetical protein